MTFYDDVLSCGHGSGVSAGVIENESTCPPEEAGREKWPSDLRHATVDKPFCCIDKAGGVRGKKRHGSGDLLRFSQAARRDLG